MGLFADDKAQDERLDALEQHLRALTETVPRTLIDFADLRIRVRPNALYGLQPTVIMVERCRGDWSELGRKP